MSAMVPGNDWDDVSSILPIMTFVIPEEELQSSNASKKE
jgi:hypothetical protein